MKKFIKKFKPFAIGVLFLNLLILIIGSFAIGILWTLLILIPLNIALIVAGEKAKKKYQKNSNKKYQRKKVPDSKNKKVLNTKNIKANLKQKSKVIVEKQQKIKKRFKLTYDKILTIVFCAGIGFLSLGILFFAYIAIASPGFDPELLYAKEPSVLYDINGNEFARLGVQNREIITYDELSEALIDAIIATEDARFFVHNGVDLPRFVNATFSQLRGRGGGGASTLTMQVVKNAFTSTDESIVRKFTDVYMAVFRVEPNYTKEEIMEFYVNSYYMGNGNWGVEQASRDYFGKSASELNVAEAAMIAGLFQAPHAFDPYRNPERTEQRRQTVLSLMYRHGYITAQERDIARELTVEKLLTTNTRIAQRYGHFIDVVVAEVVKRTGNDPFIHSMDIYTTMNRAHQDNMNRVMTGESFNWRNDEVQGAAAVVDVNNGAITAIGGGQNRTDARGFNLATDIRRQTGSAAKTTFVFAPGMEFNGWNTYTPFIDGPWTYSDGTPVRNIDGRYRGFMTSHDALKFSRNITAVKGFQELNGRDVREFVTSLGLSPEDYMHEAHALGGYGGVRNADGSISGESPLSMAVAHAAFSNGGFYVEPHSFTRIVYKDANDTYTVRPAKRRVMSEATAYMITRILEDTSGSAVGVNVNGVNWAAKTGTSNFDEATRRQFGYPRNAARDRWIASYNDSYSISLWYGYIDNVRGRFITSTTREHMVLFQAIARGVYTQRSTWRRPDTVVQATVETGMREPMLPSEFTPNDLRFTGFFRTGLEPTEVSQRFSRLPNVTNLSYSNGVLSWDPIPTPIFLTESHLVSIFTPLYGSAFQTHVNQRMAWNRSNIGNVTYSVYIRNPNGTLTRVGNTANTSMNIPASGPTTFVVRTVYSVFRANISSGAEFSTVGTSNIITSEINGPSTVNINVGSQTFSEPNPSVIVLENMLPVNNASVTIITTITRIDGGNNINLGNNFGAIDHIAGRIYQITYNVSFKGYTNTLTKTVNML